MLLYPCSWCKSILWKKTGEACNIGLNWLFLSLMPEAIRKPDSDDYIKNIFSETQARWFFKLFEIMAFIMPSESGSPTGQSIKFVVITSYSIHYTKLYDSAGLKNRPASRSFLSRFSAAGILRWAILRFSSAVLPFFQYPHLRRFLFRA